MPLPGAPRKLGVKIFLFFLSAELPGAQTVSGFSLKLSSAHAEPSIRTISRTLLEGGTGGWFSPPFGVSYLQFLLYKSINSKSWPPSPCMSGNGIIPSLNSPEAG